MLMMVEFDDIEADIVLQKISICIILVESRRKREEND
jgi:hypothetical protein